MKIGTDAVLLGAWTACEQSTKILDIGSGCGILARHNTGLTHLELLQAVDSLGTDEVIFTVILPADQETVFENEATSFGLCCIRILRIRTFQESPFVRILMEFRRTTATTVTDEMVLRNEDGTYSEGYQKLTREYHPHF